MVPDQKQAPSSAAFKPSLWDLSLTAIPPHTGGPPTAVPTHSRDPEVRGPQEGGVEAGSGLGDGPREHFKRAFYTPETLLRLFH